MGIVANTAGVARRAPGVVVHEKNPRDTGLVAARLVRIQDFGTAVPEARLRTGMVVSR